ncbi:MAG: amidase, partial [Haloferacaceae archaeon]
MDETVPEATIAELHEAMRAGALTSEALVERYLDRIAAYDRDGPALNAVVTVNDGALDRARRLDERFAADGLVGPLHGIPVLVKDQALTAGVETTFGSEAFADYVPAEDATIVERLKRAGAVVLAKTALPDWAAGFVGYSSAHGQTKNPYALDRDPGGSSAGTGAGVAANLGAVGVGEDTGGSIRVPASCCNLYGLRVTTGLVSRAGLSPLVERQDTPGPMARTVADLALVLDALVGYDPADRATTVAARADVDSYAA